MTMSNVSHTKRCFILVFVVCCVYFICTCFLSTSSLHHAFSSMTKWTKPAWGYSVISTEGSVRVLNNDKSCQRNLPGALIIGAPKCGTAALATFLSFHPDIAIRGGKELNFFYNRFENGLKWYLENMPCSLPGQLTMERSSNYFVKAGVPDRVKQMNINTKLILTVCEPVRRIISAFSMKQANGKMASSVTFSDYFFSKESKTLKASLMEGAYMINTSRYWEKLIPWLDTFPKKQLYIVNGDKLPLEPWSELSGVEDFLGVGKQFRRKNFYFNETKGFYCFKTRPEDTPLPKSTAHVGYDAIKCLTEGKGRKHVDVKDAFIKILKDYLQPHNEKFYKITGKNFNW